jgi:hypothetical protein
MSYHFQISPEFADYLEKYANQPISTFTDHLKKFKERQNYPLNLKDKRISFLSLFSSLKEFQAANETDKQLFEKARKMTIKLFEDDFFKENYGKRKSSE